MSQVLTVVQVEQPKTEKMHRQEICKVGRWMYRRGLVVACQGNLSVRLDDDRILLTPAGTCKGHLSSEDLLVTDLSGAILQGSGSPSSEMQMHLLFYRERPDVRAVCHAHPPAATGFAAAGRALDAPVLPEILVSLGEIPLAPYGTPGTWEVSAGLAPFVPEYDAILLENHGVVTCGKDLLTAYHRLETVEQSARILLNAEALGGPRLLSREQIQKLAPAKARNGSPRPAIRVELPLAGRSKVARVPRQGSECKHFYGHRAHR